MGPLTRRNLGVAAIAALVVVGCGQDGSGDLASVVLPALDGVAQEADELDTGALDGPTVLNLWATWCAPCRTELPAFQRASDEHPDVRFVGIDEGFVPSESTAFLDELGVTYEQFSDRGGAFADKLEITQLPATIVVDADGDIALRHVGPLTYDELVAAITDLA